MALRRSKMLIGEYLFREKIIWQDHLPDFGEGRKGNLGQVHRQDIDFQ